MSKKYIFFVLVAFRHLTHFMLRNERRILAVPAVINCRI